MKYIQSFYQYPVTYSSIGKGIPSKDADGELRNIVELEDKEVETLENCEPFFRELINKKKYRVLNKLPESYKPAATLVNEAMARAEKAEAELAALKSGKDKPKEVTKKSIEEMEYRELQEIAKDLGLEYKNIKKADLIKKIEEANN